MSHARFIVFEGGEGVGKGTQIVLLAQAFAAAGIPHRQSREPGGTQLGELIRPIVKTHQYPGLTTGQEVVLFSASRIAYLHEVVRPALERGEWLLSDRFAASTFVYQGWAGGLPPAVVSQVTALTLGETAPDLTLILDLPSATGLQRRETEHGDGTRFEEKGQAFHEKVRQGYLHLAGQPGYALIDASADIPTVHRAILHELNTRFSLQLQPQA